MQLVRTELSAAADASARAAARELSRTQSMGDATNAAIDAASRNGVGGQPLTLEPSDIEFGVNIPATPAQIAAGSGHWAFTPYDGDGTVNAVRITASKAAGSASGAAPLLFTPLLNTKTFQPVITTGAMQIDRDIVLVIDKSGSMDGQADDNDPVYLDYTAAKAELKALRDAREISRTEYSDGLDAIAEAYPYDTKWDALVQAVDQFLTALDDTIPEEQVGLVWFSTTAGTAHGLTTVTDDIRTAMDELGPGGWTAIGRGLDEGVTTLTDPLTARPFAQKVVVVMTDGIQNKGVNAEVVAAQVVQDHFIMIHGITFGTGADQVVMQDVADIGGGRFWHANNPGALEEAYNEVAVDIATVLTD